MSRIEDPGERQGAILLHDTLVAARDAQNLLIPGGEEAFLTCPVRGLGGCLGARPWTAVVPVSVHKCNLHAVGEEVFEVGQAGLSHSVARPEGCREPGGRLLERRAFREVQARAEGLLHVCQVQIVERGKVERAGIRLLHGNVEGASLARFPHMLAIVLLSF